MLGELPSTFTSCWTPACASGRYRRVGMGDSVGAGLDYSGGVLTIDPTVTTVQQVSSAINVVMSRGGFVKQLVTVTGASGAQLLSLLIQGGAGPQASAEFDKLAQVALYGTALPATPGLPALAGLPPAPVGVPLPQATPVPGVPRPIVVSSNPLVSRLAPAPIAPQAGGFLSGSTTLPGVGPVPNLALAAAPPLLALLVLVLRRRSA